MNHKKRPLIGFDWRSDDCQPLATLSAVAGERAEHICNLGCSPSDCFSDRHGQTLAGFSPFSGPYF